MLLASTSIGFLVAAAPVTPASAEDVPAAASAIDVSDIIVTARRRQETSIAAPVTITGIGQEELSRRALTGIETIARTVPQLMVARSASIQGANVALRGFSGSEGNPFADQPVSFIIDGAQIARATLSRGSQIDIQQIEVMKGPQALFFGKNSPAGAISIRTADPGPHFESGGSLGYEAVGREVQGDGYISGPLTDRLGARFVAYGSDLKGWLHNNAPQGLITTPKDKRLPRETDWGARLTLKYGSDTFNARLKLNYSEGQSAGYTSGTQLINCSTGVPQWGNNPPDCRLDSYSGRGDLGSNIARLVPETRDGVPFVKQHQFIHSLEMNYKPVTNITLSSLTTFYYLNFVGDDNANMTAVPQFVLITYNKYKVREFSQEFRATSSSGGRLNFLLGVYAQGSDLFLDKRVGQNALTPVLTSNADLSQKGKAYSGFGQLVWSVTDQLELSAGGRYSHETKNFRVNNRGVPVALIRPERKFNDFSPDVTLAWRPTTRFTAFASYKKGFLSGGFNAGNSSFTTVDASYEPVTIKGFEGGLKASLLGGNVRTNLSLYAYTVRGLQVAALSGVTTTIVNAGKNDLRGAEFDVRWTTPAPGLSLRGSVAYNDAPYIVFRAPCYRGQTIALGCNANPTPAGVFTAQDLAGQQAVRAPKWAGNAGFVYETSVASDLNMTLSSGVSGSSGFFTDVSNKPASWQSRYALLDASVLLGRPSGRWEIGLIGNNLTDKLYFSRSSDAPFTGSGINGTAGPTKLADTQAIASRGREVWLRIKFKFGG